MQRQLLALLVVMPALASAADWKAVKDDKLFGILLNHDSVQVLALPDQPRIFTFRWARIYHQPISLWPNKPLVKHHIFGVAASCDNASRQVAVTFEETRTEAFDVVTSKESAGSPVLSDDLRPIGDVPGLSTARDYVCARKELWKTIPMERQNR